MTGIELDEVVGAETARPSAAAWLSECHGFRVESQDGTVGFVEELLGRDDDPLPTVLLVRAGRLGRRQLAVATGTVAAVLPREGRVVLTGRARLAGREELRELRPYRQVFPLPTP